MKALVFRAFSAVVAGLLGTRVARWAWKIPGSRRIYRRLIGLRPDTVEVDGHEIQLDPTDSLLLSVNGNYEVLEQELFVSCITPGATVVDIGGHIGLYTLQAARAVGPSGRVITFEPSSANFALLESNVRRNGYGDRVELHHLALSDEPGEVVLGISDLNTGDNSIVGERAGGGETVSAARLDDVVGATPVDVIKMDIQGGEPLAIAGSLGVLSASEELTLFTEVQPEFLDDSGRPFLQSLVDLGFELFEIREEEAVVAPATVEQVARSSSDHTNIVCAKGEASVRRLADLAATRQGAAPTV